MSAEHDKRTRKANRESSIYEGSDGNWHGWVTMGVKSDGSLDRRHVKRKTQDGVQRRVRELERERDDGHYAKAGRVPTVAQWMQTYLETIAVRKLAPRTYSDYWSKTRNWIIPCIGKHRIDRLEPEHLDAMYAKMYKAGKAATHVLKVHRIISRALTIAVRRRKVARNIAQLVDPPSFDAVEQANLSAVQARKVLAAAEHFRNGARWSVGLACGLRQGEALGLRWDHVNLDTGDIRIWWQLQRGTWRHGCDDPHACGARLHRQPCPKDCKRHKRCPKPCPKSCTRHASRCPQREGGGLVFRKPKGKSRRVITLPRQLVAVLRQHKIKQDVERVLAGGSWEEHGLVFAQPNGRPIDPRRDWGEWGELLDAAGVAYVRLHDGRHTAGTLLAEQGVHVRTIQRILGHADVRTTEGYTHTSDLVVRDAAERMGNVLWDD